jgi:hypothetical protein
MARCVSASRDPASETAIRPALTQYTPPTRRQTIFQLSLVRPGLVRREKGDLLATCSERLVFRPENRRTMHSTVQRTCSNWRKSTQDFWPTLPIQEFQTNPESVCR